MSLAHWREVEAGTRYTQATAMEQYPQLHTKSFEDLPSKIAVKPKTEKHRARDVKTYLAADVEALVARLAARESVDPRWREVETGARYTATTAMARYPQLHWNSFDGLPSKIARQPKSGAYVRDHARDVKTYAAADVDALVARLTAPDQEPVDPRWLEVESGARYTVATAMARYPQLTARSMRDLPSEIARKPKGSCGGAKDVKTYLAADVDALVARLAAPEPEPVDPLWREVETGARYTQTTALAKYPQLRRNGSDLKDLPLEIARQPKGDAFRDRARDVKTYLAADVDALVARLAAPDQEPVDPRWREVETGARYTVATAMARYPQLTAYKMRDMPSEIAKMPNIGRSSLRDVKTYLAAHVDAVAEGRAWEDAAAGGGGDAGAGDGDEGDDGAGDDGDGDAAGDDGDDGDGGDDGAGGDEGAGDDGSAANRAKRPRLLGPPPLPQPPPGPEVTFLRDAAPELVNNSRSRELVRRWRDASTTAAARGAAANALADADWKEQQDPGRTCYCVSTFDSHHYDSNKDDAAADVARGVMAALHFALDEKRPCDADVRRDLCLQALACEARAQELLRSDKALRVVRALEAAILKGGRSRAAARRIVAATLFTRHHAEIKCLILIKFDNLDAVDIVMMTTLPDCKFCRGFMGAIGQVHQNVIVPHCLRPPGMPLRDAPALYYVRC